jgi:hypothetical protein
MHPVFFGKMGVTVLVCDLRVLVLDSTPPNN